MTAAPNLSAQWSALMARAQAGDSDAYNQLLKALVPAIRALARQKTADDALVEDIIQETLIAIHRARHTYDPARPLLPWVAAITAARAIDALRQAGRRREVHDEDALLCHPAPESRSGDPQAEHQEELNRHLDHLPPRQRAIVESVHLHQHSLAQAAAASHLSIAAVKSLLHRAMNNLRKSGEKHEES